MLLLGQPRAPRTIGRLALVTCSPLCVANASRICARHVRVPHIDAHACHRRQGRDIVKPRTIAGNRPGGLPAYQFERCIDKDLPARESGSSTTDNTRTKRGFVPIRVSVPMASSFRQRAGWSAGRMPRQSRTSRTSLNCRTVRSAGNPDAPRAWLRPSNRRRVRDRRLLVRQRGCRRGMTRSAPTQRPSHERIKCRPGVASCGRATCDQ
jgi:hypothetical protein